MGADSICIKDMAGLLSPYDAFELISELKKVINVPIWFCYLSIILVIIIQFVCPLIIIVSSYDNNYTNYAKYSGILLIIFTILATLLFHFPPTGSDYYAFMSNVTTIGGLGLLVYTLSK